MAVAPCGRCPRASSTTSPKRPKRSTRTKTKTKTRSRTPKSWNSIDEDDDDEDDDEDDDDEDEDEDDESRTTTKRKTTRTKTARTTTSMQPRRSRSGSRYRRRRTGASAAPTSRRTRTYRLPDLALFDPPQAQKLDDSSRSAVLEDTLASFGVGAKVTHIERGPSITRYELKPERGVKIARISALADDLALALAATSVRIEAPIPGKSAVGIEIPNATVSVVAMREIMEAMPARGTIPPLNMALGKDITGRPIYGDLGKMPHLLVAGATGSGKSVCLNCIIASLLGQRDARSSADGDDRSQARRAERLQRHPASQEPGHHRSAHGRRRALRDDQRDGSALRTLRQGRRAQDRRVEREVSRRSAALHRDHHRRARRPDARRAGQSRNADLPPRATRARDRHPPDRRDAAAVGRRDHRHHQSEHPLAHRVRGVVASRFAHDPRHGRRGTSARPRRHALSPDRRAEARAFARRADHRRRGQSARRVLVRASAARQPRRDGRRHRSTTTTARTARTSIRCATTPRSSSSTRSTRRRRSCSRSLRSAIRARCA